MQLHRDRDRLLAAGGDVVLVGMGSAAHAEKFREETGVGEDFRLLRSPDKAAYEALDLRRGSLRQVFARQAMKLGRERSAAFVARKPEQDWHQLGGAFVIAPDGEVVWEHRARHSGDNPDHDALIAALEGARAA